MPWGDLQWGSCQYDTIADMFNKLSEYPNLDDACKDLDIEVSFKDILSFESIKDKELKEVKENADADSDDSWDDYWTKQISNIDCASNMDELFCGWRDSAHDLWYALWTAEDIFTDLVIKDLSGNDVFQEHSNYTLGVIAFLLTSNGIIKDIESFKHFDT